MTASEFALPDPARLRELFDLRGDTYASRGGAFEGDVNPAFHRLRETGPVHRGVVGPLVGFHGDTFFQGLPFPDRQHVSIFDYAGCDAVLKDSELFSSTEHPPGSEAALGEKMILNMDGKRHRQHIGRWCSRRSSPSSALVDRAMDRYDGACPDRLLRTQWTG